MLAQKDHQRFVLDNTKLQAPPHVPEINLYLADEAHDLWLKTEDELGEIGLQPPFWAFAWAGGQGVARYILDNPQIVANKRVLDFATGSGMVAIAAKIAHAARVTACDIDPFCAAALSLNARANQVDIVFSNENWVGKSTEGFDVILAGDVFYDRQMADLVWPWLRKQAENGICVIVGDPGRAYLPKTGLNNIGTYQVEVTRALEDAEIKKTTVWSVG